ncbi:NEDD4-binding protein 1-like [Pieris brassicae]|nr:NEDD4-binding protein 1-like [Pieris brassicae]
MGRMSEVSITNKMSCNKQNIENSSKRIQKKKKRNKRKTNKKIKKLFDNLRQDTNSSQESVSTVNNETNSSHGSINTVIEIINSIDVPKEYKNSLTIIEHTNKTPSKAQIRRSDLNICPLQCSTPKNNIVNHNENTSSFHSDILNLTKQINDESYVTIDLTENSTLDATQPTVIDLVDDSKSIDSNISMSGDSDVTVVNVISRKRNNNQMKKFVDGIEKMDSSAKGKLLEFIAQKIFSGCDGPKSLHSFRNGINHSIQSAEDAFIKEVILRQAPSRNSIGSNIYNPRKDIKNKTGLRMIVIDGSNVAMQHTKGRVFSVQGLKICIEYFIRRGHVVKSFVPQFRCKLRKSTDGRLLDQMERQGYVVYTPSREIQGRMITSYDDRYIVQCAAEFDGVIVSTDNYRDLLSENPRWRYIIENRLLQFTWVDDMIMFPKDPLGRNGPTLEQFLRHPLPIEIK